MNPLLNERPSGCMYERVFVYLSSKVVNVSIWFCNFNLDLDFSIKYL